MRCQLASPDLWNLVLGQTLTKPACLVGWQANCVSCVCCWCMLGNIIGLANAAFSVSTAKRGQMQKAPLPTGRDRITKWQMLFSQFCCFLLSSSEHSGAAWVLRWTSATEWCFCLKKTPKPKQTLLSLTVGLVFLSWVGGAKITSVERVLDYCWAAECKPFAVSAVTCQACSLSLIL